VARRQGLEPRTFWSV